MRIAITLALTGCGDDTVPPIAELVAITDTNADPTIVEVTLVASANGATAWGYRDGAIDGPIRVPGPLIEADVGDRLIVHFRNELPQPTTIHWHGLRLPIEMDGDPMVTDAVVPGGTFDYDFVLRDPGLHWYHPHVETDMQIEMGLQGPLVVRGSNEPALRERVFVLDDVELDGDRIVIEPSHEDLMLGRRGNTVLVNGSQPGAIDAIRGSVERWRFVNTSNGRFFELGGVAMRVIGWEGGLVENPYDVERLLVGPGERYDVAVSIDRSATLQAFAYQRAHGAVDAAVELVQVRAIDGAPSGALPGLGPAMERLVPTGTRRFTLTEEDGAAGAVFFINDERWPFNTPIAVPLGAVETWEIANDSDGDHPVHVHGHFFQLDGGWKDTVVVPPRTTLRAAVRYEEPGKWMFHCQIPEHAERGMTADVEVQP